MRLKQRSPDASGSEAARVTAMRLAALLGAVATAVGLASAGAAAGAAQTTRPACLASLPEVQQVTTHSAALAGTTPVLFVHGINSGPGVWGPTSESSVAGQAAALTGVTAWTFSYAHQSLLWVTNPEIGPALAKAILCLSAVSGHKVVIVGHSMGGLAAQFALGQDHGQVAAHAAGLITIGTPFKGSRILTVGEYLANGAAPLALVDPLAAALEAQLSACAGVADHLPTNPCWLASVIRSPVGTALEANSGAIARLPSWPAGFSVTDTAGDMRVSVGVFGHRASVDFGDGAVTLSSATAHDTAGAAPTVAHCDKSALDVLSIDAGLCFHTSLPHNPSIVAAIIAAIRGYIVPPTAVVDRAPVTAAGQPLAGLTVVNGGTAQQCSAGSDSVGQAYRCFASDGIYDPCWLDNADAAQATVLCQEQPWSTQAIKLSVAQGGLEPFSGPDQPIDPAFPWGVQLSGGEQCLAAQGAHDNFRGKVIDYGCGRKSDLVLLRPLNRSTPQWTYQSAYLGTSGYTAGPVEHVRTAWYAIPDTGAAADAKASDCTATALAYAAQAYEAAHHDPNGPLPDVNAQACDDGYAEMVFTQTAPPPGYTATYAFKATPTGWTVIGSADFIIPGQFGMPANVGNAINKALESAPQNEQVPF